MNPPDPRFAARLHQAARAHRLRHAARGLVVFGASLLVAQAVIVFVVCATRPEAVFRLHRLAGAAMGALLFAGAAAGVAALVAGLRARRLVDEARAAEATLPDLGRRLSTSLELREQAPQHATVPATIRHAVYDDADAHVKASAWERFVDWRSAGVWTATAAAVLVLQAVLLLGSWANDAPGFEPPSVRPASLSDADADPEADAREPGSESGHRGDDDLPRIGDTIKITEPNEDQWATRIEAIAVTFETNTPAGLSDLSVVVNHHGVTHRFPAFSPEVAASRQSGDAEIYLDEMPLDDYDVLAYHVEGTTGGAAPRVVTSGLGFVQIRPFNEDILFRPLATGQGDPCLKLLAWMIEEERRLVRGAWLLQPGAGLPETSERYARVAETLAADHLALRGVLREGRVLFVNSPRTTPVMLTLLDEAGDAMDAADQALAAGQHDDALRHQQHALGRLIAVLREFEKIFGRFLEGLNVPETPDGPKPPAGEKLDLPSGKTLADAQLMRDDLSALDFEMAEIAEQMAQLNWEEAQQEEQETTDWRKHELAKPPDNDRGTPPPAEPKSADGDDPKDSKDAQTADAAPKESPAPGAKPASRSGDGPGTGSGTGGGEASAPQSTSADPADPTDPPPADAPTRAEQQRELADRLDELARSAPTGESVRQALRQAGTAMREEAEASAERAANPAAPSEADAGRRAEEALDRALAHRDDELQEAHLRQIERLVEQLADGQAAGEPVPPADRAELAEAAERLARATEARRPPGVSGGAAGPATDRDPAGRRAAAVASLRAAADALGGAGPSEPDVLSDDDDADPRGPEAALAHLADAQRDLQGPTAQLESLERRLSQLEDQLESQTRRARPASGDAEEAFRENLAQRARVLDAQLNAQRRAGGSPTGGEGSAGPRAGGAPAHALADSLQADADPQQPVPNRETADAPEGAKGGPPGLRSGQTGQRWEPGLAAVRGALEEVRTALAARRARDPLRVQHAGHAPVIYRDLVNRYFESLSRNPDTRP